MEKDLTTQEATKKCSCCGAIKGLSEFSKRTRSKDGFDYFCKDCRNKKQRERRKQGRYSAPVAPVGIPEELLDNIGPEYVGKPLQRRTPLSAYTPRELMSELKKRRFTGFLGWTPPAPKPRRINLSDIE